MRLSERLKRNRKARERAAMIRNVTNSVLFIAGAFVFSVAMAISLIENFVR